MRKQVFAASLVATLILGSLALGSDETYVPSDDDTVLEVLPKSLWGTRDQLVSFQTRLKESPNDALLAYQVAVFFIEAGDHGADPRFYGFARAALAPWWQTRTIPPPILRLRAKLKEKEHRYDEAIEDLQYLIRLRPRDAQAAIELTNLYRLRGDYEQVQRSIRKLTRFATVLPVAIARIPYMGLTGQASKAASELEQLSPEFESKFPATMTWVRMTQAELAEIQGQLDDAEGFYRIAMEDPRPSLSLKRAFADLLIKLGKNDEAIKLVENDLADEGALLMAAIAAKNIGDQARSSSWTKQLENRFEETRQRGDQPHGRFVARCLLDLVNDPDAALKEASKNWRQQKELVDSRLVLRAAIAAGRADRATPTIEFLREHQTEDAMALRLIAKLEAQ